MLSSLGYNDILYIMLILDILKYETLSRVMSFFAEKYGDDIWRYAG